MRVEVQRLSPHLRHQTIRLQTSDRNSGFAANSKHLSTNDAIHIKRAPLEMDILHRMSKFGLKSKGALPAH